MAGDDADDLEKLAIRLQAEKFKVLPVKNRDSVINLARSELPSLILLDFQSCFDICRILKRNFVTEPIPIIALLFPAEEVDRVAALELGADDCCQFQRYLRIRADRAEINANVAMLFGNGVCERDLPRNSSMPSDLVMICQWASLFTQSMDSRMTICSGGSNGSAALATIRAFPASPQIDVSLAQLPKGERNPLSARARSSQVEKRTVGRRHRTVLPGSNLSEAAIGVASTHSGFRAEPSAADCSGA